MTGEGDKTSQTTLNSALVNLHVFIIADNAIFGGVEVGLISEVKISMQELVGQRREGVYF